MISGIMDSSSGFPERRSTNYTLPPPVDVPRISSDGLSPSNTAVSSTSASSNSGMNSYYGHVQGSWPTPSNNSYTFTSPSQQAAQHGYPKMYDNSPMGYDPRTSRSPGSSSEHVLPPPSYDTSQHHQQTQQPSHSAPQQHSPFSRGLAPVHPTHQAHSPLPTQPPILTSNGANASSAPLSGGLSLDTYKTHSPNQSYYTTAVSGAQPTTTPTHTSFSSYSAPLQPSPVTAASLSRGLPSVTQSQYAQMPYTSMHHSMGRPVLSNLGNPGGPMSMMSNMPLSYMSSMGYMSHGPPPQERPYKCDQCPQSFNRNHDLKRHKRIHLSVKPFPCTFCDKSFSRKDALKRHRLVKGCGSRSTQRDAMKKGDVASMIPEQTQSS